MKGMPGPYDIIGLRLHLVRLACGLWAWDTPVRSGGHTFPQWEDTPSLHPGLNQECPPLAGMSPESACTLK